MVIDKKQAAYHRTTVENKPDLSRRKFLVKSSWLATAGALISTSLPTSAALRSLAENGTQGMYIFKNPLCFSGAVQDHVTGLYHLGEGYRAYHPRLKRFLEIDSLSPFEEGGIHGYQYCLGDPVNLIDPTGHLSWQAGVAIGLGILAVLIGVVTLGSGIAASAGLISGAVAMSTAAAIKAGLVVTAGVTGTVSGALGIASGAVSGSNPEASANLGYAALAFGIASAVTGIGSLVAGARVTAAAQASFRGSLNPSLMSSASGSGQTTLRVTSSVAHYHPKFVARTLNQAFNGQMPFQRIAISGKGGAALFKGSTWFSNSYAQNLANQTGRQVIELARNGQAVAPKSGVTRALPSLVKTSSSVARSNVWKPTRVFGPSRVMYSSAMIGRALIGE